MISKGVSSSPDDSSSRKTAPNRDRSNNPELFRSLNKIGEIRIGKLVQTMQRFRRRNMAFGNFLSDIARTGMKHQPHIVFGVETDLYKVVQSVTSCALDFKRQSRISILL